MEARGSLRMNKLVGFLVFLVTFLAVLGIAIYLDRNLRSREPSSRPYRWGYFFAIYYCVIMSGALLADRAIAHGLTAGAIIVALGFWLLILVFGCYPILRRYQAGWVVGTILSLNP